MNYCMSYPAHPKWYIKNFKSSMVTILILQVAQRDIVVDGNLLHFAVVNNLKEHVRILLEHGLVSSFCKSLALDKVSPYLVLVNWESEQIKEWKYEVILISNQVRPKAQHASLLWPLTSWNGHWKWSNGHLEHLGWTDRKAFEWRKAAATADHGLGWHDGKRRPLQTVQRAPRISSCWNGNWNMLFCFDRYTFLTLLFLKLLSGDHFLHWS